MNSAQFQPVDNSTPAFLMYKKLVPKVEKKHRNSKLNKFKKSKVKVNEDDFKVEKNSSPATTKIRIKQSLRKDNFIQKKKPVKSSKLKSVKKSVHKKTKIVSNVQDVMINGKSNALTQQNDQDSDNCLTNNEFEFSDNPMEDALKLFKWVIAPIKPNVFFNEYWEKKAIHIKRLDETYYTQILNSDILDKILRNNYLEYTRNVDVVCYENGNKEVYNAEGRATPSALWDYYSNGCSIRILNPQTYCNKVHLLLSMLQEYFGSMVGANVYLTPPNSQGFAPHYDDIEAFVIQLEGRKHWKLYHPKDADVLARFSSPNLSKKDIGDPFMELTLNAGEILYFPRGTIHEGHTDQSAHSLHITVSVYQRTSFADLLEHMLPNALKKASESDVEFRRGLPLNYLKHLGVGSAAKYSKDFKSTIETQVKNLTQLLVNYIDIDAAADSLGRKFIYDSMPPVLSKNEIRRCSKADGPSLTNGKVVNRVVIDLDTRIRLLRYYCIRLVHEPNSTPKLYYNTENANVYHGEEEQYLELDTATIALIQTLQASYPSYIEVCELPMEDEILKMQCISDLWEHGLIVTEKPLRSIT